jgi:hypothetical protein
MKNVYTNCVRLIVFGVMLLTFAQTIAQTTVTIGTGASSGTAANSATGDCGPMYRSTNSSNFTYSRYHYLYTQAELAAAGITPGSNLSKLAWNKDNVAGTNSTFTFQIWIKNSNKTTVGAAGQLWSDLINGSTQVYNSSTVTLGTAAQWHEFDFSAPFLYTGGAIEISVNFDISNGVSPWTTAGFSWKRDAINDRTLSYVGSSAPATTLPNLRTVRPQIQITTAPASGCTSPPTAGAATSSVSTAICSGNPVNLNLAGNSIGSGQTYMWQKSTDPASPHTWSDIPPSASTTGLSVNPTTTTFYRAAVTCSGVTSYSDSVKVLVNPTFPAGTYTIDKTLPASATNFQSFAAAVSAINCGISGNIIFNVASNQVFNEDIPVINAVGNSSATITFQKNGTGANPKIIPLSAGTIASSTTLGNDGDGIIILNGTDYITFDGIDLDASSGFSGTGMYEYGYYLKKASATDACKNVVIKNSAITLIRTAIYSFGVFISNNSGSSSVTVSGTGGRSENIKVFNNTISGCYSGINVTGYAATTPFDLYDQNIEIGVDGPNIIDQYGGGATTAYGIYSIYQNNLKVANNTITSATGTTTTLYGIFLSTGTNSNADVYGNTITITGGGTTSTIYALNNAMGATGTNNMVKIYNNTITNCAYPTATTGVMYLLYQNASAYKAYIYNNNVVNNTHSPTTTGAMYCLYQSGAVVNESKVYNNTVSNNQKATGTTGSVYLIYHSPATTASGEIYGNIVSGNSSTNTTSGILYGIYQGAGTTTNIYKNKVFDLTSNSTGGSVYGLAITAGTTNNVYNNFVSDLKAPGVNSADAIRAISVTGTAANTAINVSYNTVYLNASSSGVNFGTSAVYHTVSATATTAALTLRNNNLVNISTPAGTGLAAVYRRSGVALNNYTNTSDRNNFFAGIGGNPNNVLFYDGTNSDADMNSFKTRMATRDNSSVSEDPPFVDISATPYDLNIKTTVPTQLESGGAPVSGITDDYYGTVRNASSPDIGAHEFIGISADLTGPAITYTALANTICTDPRTIIATIIDASGVNTSAGTKPRLWFKKASENDALPATNTSAGNGWKWVEASNAASPFTFTIDYNLLNSPVTGGDSISYFIVAQDNIASPNVGVNAATFNTTPASVALSAGTFPLSGTVKGYNVLPQPSPVMVKTSRTELCVSGAVTLDLDGITAPGGGYQWQSSPAGTNTWADIAGATTIPYTTGTISASTDFRLVIKCGGTPIAGSPSNVLSVTVNNPQVLTTTPGSRCGVGTVGLSATATPGASLSWYAGASGGTAISTGNIFTTPVISTTTNFYVAANNGGSTANVGLAAPTSSFISGAGTTNYGLVFDVTSPFTLNSVTVYPVSASSASGTVTIDVINSSGTVVHTATFNVTGSPVASPVPYVANVNFNLQPGTNYKMRPGFTGITGLLFGPSPSSTFNYGYPFAIPGVVSINTSTLTAAPTNTARNDLYYYFFNWEVSTGCEGSRTLVAATVTPPPALTVTASKTICNNSVHMLSVTSPVGDFNSYVWSPQTDLFTDAAATIPYAGGNATQVYVKSATAGAPVYTLTATNTSTQCSNTATSTVTVMPDPVINAVPAEICISGTSSLTLNPSTGYGAATLQWQMSTDGTTFNDIAAATATNYTTPTITQTRYYKMIQKDGAGATCSQSPTVTVTVNNPQVTGTTPASRCGNGTVTLGATATAGATLNWYTASTGGSPVSTGPSFTTPTLSSNTTYYVSASNGGGGVSSLGRANRTDMTANTNTNSGLVFSAPTGGVLQSVSVYPSGSGAGTLTIVLKTGNTAGATVIASATVNLTGVTIGSATKTVVPLNFIVPPGSNYYLSAEAWSGGVSGLGRELTGGGPFPYTSPSSDWQITASWLTTGAPSTTTHYYYFYDWVVVQGCESSRTAVVATVTTPSSNAAGASGTTECATKVISGSTDYNYTDCDPIAVIMPIGASPVSGSVNACVTIDATVQTAAGEPYVQRHYNITPAVNPLTATSAITLYFLQGEFDAFNTASGFYAKLPTSSSDAAGKANLRITQYNGTGTAPGNYTGTAVQIDPADGSILWNSTANRWEVTFSATGSGGFYIHTGKFVLPVTGLELKGDEQGAQNRLSWNTVTETNNKGFGVQRSTDGKNFSGIGFMATKAVEGNSTSPLSYSYMDAKPFAGNTYYRLQQVDKDGRVSYSNVVLLGRKVSDIILTSVYPNPTEKELNVVITSPRMESVTIIITDLRGGIVMRKAIQLVSGENQQQLKVQSLAAGTYLIKAVCTNGCETAVQRFVKQ